VRSFVASDVSNPLVIVGLPGAGKTSLVSFFAKQFHSEHKRDKTNSNNDKNSNAGASQTSVISHFIGAAPDSTNIRNSLARLVKEIALHFDLELADVPDNFSDLQNMFKETIEKVGKMSEKRLILIIDALNQLDATNHAHALEWLPTELPGYPPLPPQKPLSYPLHLCGIVTFRFIVLSPPFAF